MLEKRFARGLGRGLPRRAAVYGRATERPEANTLSVLGGDRDGWMCAGFNPGQQWRLRLGGNLYG